MPIILLKATTGDAYTRQLTDKTTAKHTSYIKGLLSCAPYSDFELEIPHADKDIIDFIVDWLDHHEADDEIPDDWEKKRPLELTDWDRARMVDTFVGVALINLMKAANFIGCQLMLNAVATYVGQVLVTKSERDVMDYFGVHREWTAADEAMVKEKFRTPFM